MRICEWALYLEKLILSVLIIVVGNLYSDSWMITMSWICVLVCNIYPLSIGRYY